MLKHFVGTFRQAQTLKLRGVVLLLFLASNSQCCSTLIVETNLKCIFYGTNVFLDSLLGRKMIQCIRIIN